jgi:glycerol-3-phosphate dehydrogenase
VRIGDRAAALQRLASGERWDVIVAGGGITGAGIAREAARRGLSCLLVEQRDFAWGTSSRSSKMVHGGLRYLGAGQVGLARKAVAERERLIAEAPGLVDREEYLYPVRKGVFPGRLAYGAVLAAYDVLGGKWRHSYLSSERLLERAPGLSREGLRGGYVYTEGVTDDARLVLRVLGEAVADGAIAVNYARVTGLVREDGRVTGVEYAAEVLADGGNEEQLTGVASARVVIDATGAWTKRLEPAAFGDLKVRPLRGSHLVLAADRLNLQDPIILMHPRDGRPVFVFPWLGRMGVGTTDIDDDGELDEEAVISQAEVEYLLELVEHATGERIARSEVISTWAGVRPVLSEGAGKKPSDEKRDEAVWSADGIVCASGGKLTTFRLIAVKALEQAAPMLGGAGGEPSGEHVFTHPAPPTFAAGLPTERRRTLAGRLGAGLEQFAQLPGHDAPEIDGTGYALPELRYAARYEMVEHLDDLLLRRTRLGNLLDGGGTAIIDDVESICRQELGWDDGRWRDELTRYRQIWQRHYGPPGE